MIKIEERGDGTEYQAITQIIEILGKSWLNLYLHLIYSRPVTSNDPFVGAHHEFLCVQFHGNKQALKELGYKI